MSYLNLPELLLKRKNRQSQQSKYQSNIWNLVEVNNIHQDDVIDIVLVSLLVTLTDFAQFLGVSVVNFK